MDEVKELIVSDKTCGECKHFDRVLGICDLTDDFSTVMSNTLACADFEICPKPTNGDVIRQMLTSELINVIKCPYPDEVCIHRRMNGYACECCKRDWLNAPAKEVKDERQKAECAYCGRTYKKKKKAQRFCSIKCKDKWWNRERFADSEYLHPHCEDNFSGDC